MNVSDMLDMLALNFNSSVSAKTPQRTEPSFPTIVTHAERMRKTREEREREMPQKDPTLLDWEEVIIPELRRYLYRTNAAHYEIEEWIRRVRAQMMLGNEKALLFVAKEVLGGTRPPSKILQFFPPELRQNNYSLLYRRSDEPQETGLLTSEVNPQHVVTRASYLLLALQGTNEATTKLKEEWEFMKMLNDQNLDFTAGPSANDLYHWYCRVAPWYMCVSS